MKTKIILFVSCLVFSCGSVHAQFLKQLGKVLNEASKAYNEIQDAQNRAYREAAERYEAEKRESFQRLQEQGWNIDPNKMAEDAKNEIYGEHIDKADAWDESKNQKNDVTRALDDITIRLNEYRERKREQQLEQEEREEEARLEREEREAEIREAEEEARLEREEAEREAQLEHEESLLRLLNIENSKTATEIISSNVEIVWAEHNVSDGDTNGMNIHVKFSVHGMLNKQGTCNAYFSFHDDNILNDYNGLYKTETGQVACGLPFTPPYEDTIYNDFTFFMPYNELHLGTGSHNLKFKIGIFDDNKLITISHDVNFTCNVP